MPYIKNLLARWPKTTAEAGEIAHQNQFIRWVDGELAFAPLAHGPLPETCAKAYDAEVRIREIRRSIWLRRLLALFGR